MIISGLTCNDLERKCMPEWDETVMSSIDKVVDTATNKVVRPAHKFARFSVYSIVIGVLITIILIFLFVSAFRATDILLPTYGTYLVWGGIFVGVGALLWVKK